MAERDGAGRKARGQGVQTVYDALKHDILMMTLAPGEPLDETRLSHRFAMSRTPVREALVRLAAEGLVTTLPNRNTIVAPIDFATVPTYFDALVLMYRVTTRLAAFRRSDADLDAIRAVQRRFAEAVAGADALAMVTVNRDFHLAIA
ncbi:MAG: GntR family transcriptional regulator, partial [Rhizobiales bacterium]|nr:GntR family transcriptional regulator [Hyphomicrobiales bacterium]